MSPRIIEIAFFFIAVFTVALCFSEPKQIHSLAESKQALTPKGRQVFDEELEGIKKSGLNGKPVRNEALRQALLKALAEKSPGSFPEDAKLLLTKWKGGGRYLCHCFTDGEACSDTFAIGKSAFLAIVKIDTITGSVKAVAVLSEPFAGAVPPSRAGSSEEERDIDSCDEVAGYDFAPFVITSGDTAFGIRTGHTISYAGGFDRSEMLHLFHRSGDALRRVASIKVYHMSNLAGDWHDNGTRDHQIDEEKWIIKIGKKGPNGFNDLIVADAADGKTESRLRWDPKLERYQP